MSDLPGNRPTDANSSGRPLEIVAIVLSALGLLGWFTLTSLLLPYDDPSTPGTIGNVVAFGLNFIMLLVGVSISGTLSFCGLLSAMVATGRVKRRLGTIGIVLGTAGLAWGAGLLIWRHHLIFG
jgi:hypothetical protein